MNQINEQLNNGSGAPENLPHIDLGNGNGEKDTQDKDSNKDSNNDENVNVEFSVSKKKLKTFLKIAIIVIIILISLPRIINNVSSTLAVVQGQAEKFPQIFPTLTATGTGIGSFAYSGVKSFSNFIGENLASMAELLYSRKIQPGDITIDSGEVTEIKATPIKVIINKIGVDSIILNMTVQS